MSLDHHFGMIYLGEESNEHNKIHQIILALIKYIFQANQIGIPKNDDFTLKYRSILQQTDCVKFQMECKII